VTPPVGLSREEAARRLAQHGPNRLPAPARPSPLRQLAGQFLHFFAAMLWVAAALAAIAGLPELAVAIVVVVLLNGTFAFFQEHRAERAAAALHDLVPRRVTVRRDGSLHVIDAAELVPGDVMLVTAGDRVSADGALTVATALQLDRSTLTGESVPEILEAGDRLEAGTFVVEGEGEALVEATGSATRLAGIAAMTQHVPRSPTPLARELHRVVRTIAGVAVGVGVGFFVLSFLLDVSRRDAFVFAVGVTVALVPEGLLPTVTLSLAIGAQRMASRNALVRRLESVETLGSTTFICTDKTGTLTRNEMEVVVAWTAGGTIELAGGGYGPAAKVQGHVTASHRDLASALRTCSRGRAVATATGWEARGDPMEAAGDAFARRLGVTTDPPVTAWIPFDPRRRRMSAVVGHQLITKGSPEAVLEQCHGDLTAARETVDQLTHGGSRVLAVATRELAPGTAPTPALERDLTLLGLVGLEDPPRASARDAVADCRRAGIAVALLTGDHPATALAIARQVGIAGPEGTAVLAAELPTDIAVLGATVDRDGIVIARASPEDKLRIAHALRQRDHVVAMTGDGVNDGPALREADIGVAMGRSGTDVAREAADVVLLDDEFKTIVAAIAQGRATYRNIGRFLTYHLTDNVAELAPFVIWALWGDRIPLALGVLQILALDLGTDTLSAVALGAEPPEADALGDAPARGRLLDRLVARRAFGVLGPTEAVMEMTAFFVTLAVLGWRPGDAAPVGHDVWVASGAAFLSVVFGQAANAFACRSDHRPVRVRAWAGNRLLLAAVLIASALGIAAVAVPAMARLLDHRWPNAVGWAVVAATPVVLLLTDRVDKYLRNRR
jgi:magnesium-transporting ATPase (P-type)